MENCNLVKTPLDPNSKLTKDMSPLTSEQQRLMESVPYQEAVGSLMYTAQLTRPDICYAVSSLSRFNNNPGEIHWQAVKRVFRYLKGTAAAKLEFKRDGNSGEIHWQAVKRVFRYLKGTAPAKLEFKRDGNSEIIGYCDADWAADTDDRKSITGYVYFACGGAISWCTKKQQTVALSTTEAEYMSLTAASQEGMWLKRLENELCPMSGKSFTIYCDNQSAIALACSNTYNARTKHIDVKHHFIKELLNDGKINLEYISSDKMIADYLTKAVSTNKQIFCTEAVGIVNC
ncbi:hypothetical protein QE152_g6808 [Popillia japonica]|uniref:Polyprotein n=1 Tax=Popillia japonica TaxID=7064 RepID=A0AAW1MHG6_POPJA